MVVISFDFWKINNKKIKTLIVISQQITSKDKEQTIERRGRYDRSGSSSRTSVAVVQL